MSATSIVRELLPQTRFNKKTGEKSVEDPHDLCRAALLIFGSGELAIRSGDNAGYTPATAVADRVRQDHGRVAIAAITKLSSEPWLLIGMKPDVQLDDGKFKRNRTNAFALTGMGDEVYRLLLDRMAGEGNDEPSTKPSTRPSSKATPRAAPKASTAPKPPAKPTPAANGESQE